MFQVQNRDAALLDRRVNHAVAPVLVPVFLLARATGLRIGELLDQYADLDLGTVDASVLAACERLGAAELATLDHRHFSVIKPRHRESLTLLPG